MSDKWTSHNLRIAGETIQDHTEGMAGDVLLDADAHLRVMSHMKAADEEIAGLASEVDRARGHIIVLEMERDRLERETARLREALEKLTGFAQIGDLKEAIQEYGEDTELWHPDFKGAVLFTDILAARELIAPADEWRGEEVSPDGHNQ